MVAGGNRAHGGSGVLGVLTPPGALLQQQVGRQHQGEGRHGEHSGPTHLAAAR
jgi:hypothetical protein